MRAVNQHLLPVSKTVHYLACLRHVCCLTHTWLHQIDVHHEALVLKAASDSLKICAVIRMAAAIDHIIQLQEQ